MKKKLQKVFAMLLVISMVMSLMSVTAFAEETNADAGIATVSEEDIAALNPSYTVQYWANLPVLATSGEASDIKLKVIDTTVDTNKNLSVSQSDGVQVKNGTINLPTRNIYIDTSDGSIRTTTKMTRLYKDQEFSYYDAPNIDYINQVDSNYTLKEVRVKNGDSWVQYPASVAFTNDASKAGSNTIVITKDTVLCLVYDVTNDTKYNANATFFDYDITNGYTSPDGGTTVSANTWKKGINAADTIGSGARLAFGNANTNNGYADQIWDDGDFANELNVYNGKYQGTDNFEGCTFGLVQSSLDSNGLPLFSFGVKAPDLFSNVEIESTDYLGNKTTAKTVYSGKGNSVTFNRVGDTYTFTKATVDGDSLSGLDTFDKLTGTSDSGYTYTIWSNNFFPMDEVKTAGAEGHDPLFGSRPLEQYRTFHDDDGNAPSDNTFPTSDDYYNDHNSYFGMKYEVQFKLTKDYVGPLDYTFFGDDDMWVFLTDSKGNSTLVCDIGGVHSSVGQYVDLWDYIDGGKDSHGEDTYTLSFFYTERGASGSTCYMRFTLPSVNSPKKAEQASLRLEKDVVDESKRHTGGQYTFNVQLSAANNVYSCARYNAKDEKIGSQLVENGKVTVTLKDGEYALIGHLPKGTTYTITEINGDMDCEDTTHKHTVSVNGKADEDKIASGTLSNAEEYTVSYENKYEHFTNVSVTKVWNDQDDKYGERPDSIQVDLLAKTSKNGVYTKVDGKTATLSAKTVTSVPAEGEDPVTSKVWDAETTYTWENLPKYENGYEIEYSVQEVGLSDKYASVMDVVAEDPADPNSIAYTITNTPKAKLTIKKVVTGNVSSDKTKTFDPGTFIFEVKKDGEAYTTISLPKSGDVWEETLSALPDGTYTVTEKTGELNANFMRDGFAWTSVSYNGAGSYSAELKAGDDAEVIATNTYKYVPESTQITVKKVWDDGSNRDGIRPVAVVFELHDNTGNNIAVEGMQLRLDVSEGKDYADGTFIYHPRYGIPTVVEVGYIVLDEEGNEVFVEGVAPGYTADTSLDSTSHSNDTPTITNKYEPEVVKITVAKEWDDSTEGRTLPEKITVVLKADGKEVNRADIVPEEIQVPVVKDETVTEGTTEEGAAAEPETVTEIVWNPVTFTTEKDGKTPLYKYDDGTEIKYTIVELIDGQEVKEDANRGWVAEYDDTEADWEVPGSEDAAFDWVKDMTITNSYISGGGGGSKTTSVKVTKEWNDDNDAAGVRPESITVQLLKNGEVYEEYTLNAGNKWKKTWNGLSKSDEWTVIEVDVPEGYSSVVEPVEDKENQFVITNTYDTTVIEEEETPLTNLPDGDVPLDDIFDEEVPLAMAPATGDVSALWLALSALSGTGLAGVSFLGRKKRDDEE